MPYFPKISVLSVYYFFNFIFKINFQLNSAVVTKHILHDFNSLKFVESSYMTHWSIWRNKVLDSLYITEDKLVYQCRNYHHLYKINFLVQTDAKRSINTFHHDRGHFYSSFISVSFCFLYFKCLLLDAYLFKIPTFWVHQILYLSISLFKFSFYVLVVVFPERLYFLILMLLNRPFLFLLSIIWYIFSIILFSTFLYSHILDLYYKLCSFQKFMQSLSHIDHFSTFI